jgi:hypothetical protein
LNGTEGNSILSDKELRLCRLHTFALPFGLLLLARDTLTVERPFLDEVERVRGEAKLLLRDRQSFAPFLGRSGVEVAQLPE